MSSPRKPQTQPPRPEALKKLAQLQIERLKKEEEEEQWISGEELYTEGSSDEDDAAFRAKRRGNEGKNAKKAAKGTAVKERKQHGKPKSSHGISTPLPELDLTLPNPDVPLKESQLQNLSLSERERKADESPVIIRSTKNSEYSGENATSSSSLITELDEEQTEISWRPKRGSIKLPNLTSEGYMKQKKKVTFLSVEETEKSYIKILKNIKTLKSYLCTDDSYIPEKLLCHKYDDKRTLDEIAQELRDLETEPVDSTEWDSYPDGGVDESLHSAFLKMNKLDALLNITEAREREARQETLNLQLQIREDLDKLYKSQASKNKNSALVRNTASFYQLCPLAKKQVKIEGEIGEGNCPNFKLEKKDSYHLNFDNNNNEQFNEVPDCEKEDVVPIFKTQMYSEDEDAFSADEAKDNGNKKGTRPKKKKPHFILRNIKLAAQGMGTLSITVEEKEKLENLLKDLEENDNDKKTDIENYDRKQGYDVKYEDESQNTNNTEYLGYMMDPETEKHLRNIESKLEHLYNGSVCGSQSRQSINGANYTKNHENELLDDKKRGWKEATAKKRLHEIDQSLLTYAQPVHEAVEPLEEMQLQRLVERYSTAGSSTATHSQTSIETNDGSAFDNTPQWDCSFASVTTQGDGHSNNPQQSETQSDNTTSSNYEFILPPRLSREVLDDLIEQAKIVMPCFKFKHAV